MTKAEAVFASLAAEILRGELPAGASLPSERVLGERFGASRIIVRQAVHRLAELGLVRATQGGPTRILDAEQATDPRVLALYYRLAPEALGAGQRDLVEKQYLQGLSMVSVATRRASPESLLKLARLAQSYGFGEMRHAPVEEFEQQFWRGLSRAGGNRIFIMEVAWWYEVLRERPLPARVRSLPRKTRLGFYVELLRRLAEKDSPVEFYLRVTSPILDALFASG